MALDDGQERSEAPSEDRRDLFRKRGDIAHSRELTSILTLAFLILTLSFYGGGMFQKLQRSLTVHFATLDRPVVSSEHFSAYIGSLWVELLQLIFPLFLAVSVAAIFFTLLQTRMNFSFEKITPNFSKLNPLTGLGRIFSFHSILEIFKGMAKTIIVGITSYLILFSELKKLPFLSRLPLMASWVYWVEITKNLLLTTIGLLLLVAAIDYIYSYFHIENQMKMTKQELKEEYRQREVDPMIKSRLRRMAREFSSKRTMEATKKATVLITNPTHFSIAVQYEMGMRAPIVLAKGADHIAFQMREIAKSMGIPIVENKPLARTLYATIKINQEVPETLYKALSEVISYVFKAKGIKVQS
jgi:flagellar biosynthetic protein FlhB